MTIAVKAFYNNDDCRRFTLEGCSSEALWNQLATLFKLDTRSFFEEHRMTITHGAVGVNNVGVPTVEELAAILDILSKEDLGKKPIVVRIVKNESKPVAETANPQVTMALNDAHVAALAQLDRAKSNLQSVKVANRQALAAAREQAQTRLQVARETVNAAKAMAGKTSTALKALGLKAPAPVDTPVDTPATETPATEMPVDMRGKPEEEKDLFALGNVIQFTPVGMDGQLRITPVGAVDAYGRRGGLTRFQVMARQGDLIKLARNGDWLRLHADKVDGKGHDEQVPWIQVVAHADGSVSLVCQGSPEVGLAVSSSRPGRHHIGVEAIEKTESITKFTVVKACGPDARRRHGAHGDRARHGRGRRCHMAARMHAGMVEVEETAARLPTASMGRRGLRHVFSEVSSLKQAAREQERPTMQEHSAVHDQCHQAQRQQQRQECINKGGRGRPCGREPWIHGRRGGRDSFKGLRVEALDRQLTQLQACRARFESVEAGTEEQVKHRTAHLARLNQRVTMLEQARAQALDMESAVAPGDRVAAPVRQQEEPTMVKPTMVEPTMVESEEESGGDDVREVQDSDGSEDWVQVSYDNQTLTVGDQIMLKNIASGQVVGMEAVNRSIVLLQDTDDASALMEVMPSRVDKALKLRAVTNPKAYLRLGPKSEDWDMKGLGGVWTDFMVHLDADGTVSLMSARRPNHFAACVDNSLKAMPLKEGESLPTSAKFVVHKV